MRSELKVRNAIQLMNKTGRNAADRMGMLAPAEIRRSNTPLNSG